MDDLDHSIHIAEYDWMSFCEESEECSLLKPSIACSDSSGLSDSEDSESSSPEQLNKTRTGEEKDEKSLAKLDCDICSVCSAENTLSTTEVHVKAAEETKATNNITESPHKLKKEVRLVETEIDNYRNEAAPSFVDQTDVNGNEPPATDAALSRVHARAEKERWFVTVNDRPARQQAAAVSVKRKTRQKQPRKNSWSTNQETSVENSLMMKDKKDSKGGRDKRGFVQLKQPLVQKPGEVPSAQINLELPLMCRENETVSKILLTNSLTEPIAEATMGRNTHDPGSVSRDVFSLEAPSHMETAESDELEFCSIHSYDSESYLSAAESTEEPLYRLKDHVTENQQPLLLSTSHLLNTSHAPDRGLLYCDNTLSRNVSATKCDGYEGTGVEPTLAVPYADQRANKMPGDNSTCDKDAHSTELCVSSHTLQNQDTHLSASGSSSGHQLSPCSVSNSSGTYAEAAGLTGPVYAMSAFWNEMEKMTINDILRLRVGRSTQTQETVTPSVHDHTFRAECNPSDGPMDTSDVADSDYFTQPDESKPDCSSCEFSTSDFEEDYWQFIGASRNPSPDPQGKNHPNTTGSAFLCNEELLCTRCEEKDPHVPSEDCAGQRFDHHESHTLMKPFQLGGITKTQTLNTEELTSQSLFGVDENSLFLSHSQALEENLALKQNNSLETLMPSPGLSSTDMLDKRYQISIPEAFEYFFTEDEAKNDTHGTVYNHQDISMTPVRDCTLCTFRNEMPFSALHDSQCSKEKPIPIFSCSHSTVRDLTFPKPSPLFLNAHSENGDISPALPHFLSQDSLTWKSLLSISKICFHTKGSTWCRRSGAWVFPVDAEKRKDPPSAAITEGRFHWRIWETLHSRQEGVFSTLKQSDMCLVCIAFASWVLRSSNPEAADAWKAALLANVSALSAIQFLRHYVKKTPLLDDP